MPAPKKYVAYGEESYTGISASCNALHLVMLHDGVTECTYKEMVFVTFTQEEKDLLERFQNTFVIRANAYALQRVIISETGTINYEDTEVYGDTSELDIIYKGEVVLVIDKPSDDMKAILDFAKKWQAKGYPYPQDDSDLFDTQG